MMMNDVRLPSNARPVPDAPSSTNPTAIAPDTVYATITEMERLNLHSGSLYLVAAVARRGGSTKVVLVIKVIRNKNKTDNPNVRIALSLLLHGMENYIETRL